MGKVFGIGLSRTGTTSLTAALQHLGYRAEHFPSDPCTQREVLRYLTRGGDALHLSLLEQHDALTDTPICAAFQALDRGYPGSRFVLTVRDKTSWLRSCERHWSQVLPILFQREGKEWTHYACRVNEALYGSAQFDPVLFSRAYDTYHARVRRYFAGRDDLLVLDVCAGEGWEKLAPFLNAPRPPVEFPRENQRVRPRTGLRMAWSRLRRMMFSAEGYTSGASHAAGPSGR